MLHALEQAAAQKRVNETHYNGNGDSKSEGNGKGKTKNDDKGKVKGKGKFKGKGKGKIATETSISRLDKVLHVMEQVVVQDSILPDFPKYEYKGARSRLLLLKVCISIAQQDLMVIAMDCGR